MFNRTMSYLFLTVVAAAVFLVSGCAPIDNQGGQVQAVEAERIEKLEKDVAKAVAAVEPGRIQQQMAEVVKEGVKAVKAVGSEPLRELLPTEPEETKKMLQEDCPEDKKLSKKCVITALKYAIWKERDLQTAVRDILCIRPGTITLRDVYAFKKEIDGGLIKDRLKGWIEPDPPTRWNKEKTVYTLRYKGYKDMTRAKSDAIRRQINEWAKEWAKKKVNVKKVERRHQDAVDFVLVAKFQKAEEKSLEQRLTGWIKPDLPTRWNGTVYTLRYKDMTRAKYDEIRRQINKWAKLKGEQVVLGHQDDFKNCTTDEVEVKADYVGVPGKAAGDTTQTYAVSVTLNVQDVLAVSRVFLAAPWNHWLYPDSNITDDQKIKDELDRVFTAHPEIIRKDTKVWPIRIEGELSINPVQIIKNPKKTKTVYIMIAREHEVPGYPKPFRVVQYREVDVDKPQGRFTDKQIPLKNPTLQPACPPEDQGIPDAIKNKFRKYLDGAPLYWGCE